MKPLIHFAHANGVPSRVYQRLFDALAQDFDVIYTPVLGIDPQYPVDNQWSSLTRQVTESVLEQANGRPVIGLGHSLGAVLTLQSSLDYPELFNQVIMLDPPLMVGKMGLTLDVLKRLKLKALDRLTPAGLSVKRREHWDSREQAHALLRDNAFYKNFDATCFDHYIEHALTEDHSRGGVTLTIPRDVEVQIFRTHPSQHWLPRAQPEVAMHLVMGQGSAFVQYGLHQAVQKKWGIPYTFMQGGHMFPLEYPEQLAKLLRDLI